MRHPPRVASSWLGAKSLDAQLIDFIEHRVHLLPAGIDMDHGPGQHADLRHPEKGQQPHAGEPHQQVDGEKRENRH